MKLTIATCISVFVLLACGQPDAAAPVTGGLLGRFPMTAGTVQQWKLPARLKEISGLALNDQQRLFAVADEQAIIYELDFAEARIISTFTLSRPAVRGDFEGIAVVGDYFFLTTSNGEIYRSREGEDGETVGYDRYETGLGKHCEIEGLAALDGNLLLLCKKVRSTKLVKELSIFVWSSETRQLLPEGLIKLPESEILRRLRMDRLSPSGLAVDPGTGHLVIVAAQQRTIVEMTTDGKLIQAMKLPLADRHQQAEGIEVARANKLLISDEGAGRKARLSIYRDADAGEEENK